MLSAAVRIAKRPSLRSRSISTAIRKSGSRPRIVTSITAASPRTLNHSLMRDRRYYCVYMMGSITGTLYIGLGGNLHKRVFQHKFQHH
jgi:hypothetical protein